MTLSLLQEMFKLFFFALIVYISYNSKITRDKIFRLFFWIPIATTYIGSALIQTDFRDFGVILLVLSLISVLFVYGLHFLKREKELLDYLKIFWLLLIVADLAMVNLFRFFSNKSINQSLDFTKDLVNRVDLMIDIVTGILLLVISAMIFIKNKKVFTKIEE